tara:strand:- start:1358 stop:1927 length:570 start_codon:yes stop_codon:yes gene_type:complete
MPKPTRLHRSYSYPYNISEDVELQKYTNTESGMFLLTVLNDEGDFMLEIPTSIEGKYDTIFDSFEEFQDREALYKKLESGVYEFIQDSMEEFQTLNMKENPEGTDIVVSMNNDRYVLSVVQSTGVCTMKYPERETKPFYIDNIFLENAELPLIREGRLIQHLAEQVKKKLGLSLPKTPYFPALKLTPKD